MLVRIKIFHRKSQAKNGIYMSYLVFESTFIDYETQLLSGTSLKYISVHMSNAKKSNLPSGDNL